jgi:hypothetical protein
VFHTLQQALTTAPVLQLPDFDQPFVMECDASGAGVGAVLHQGSGAIVYFSRQIVARHAHLVAYERKRLGSSRQALVRLSMGPGVHSEDGPLQLQVPVRPTFDYYPTTSMGDGYDFCVQYKSGTSNTVADACLGGMEARMGSRPWYQLQSLQFLMSCVLKQQQWHHCSS